VVAFAVTNVDYIIVLSVLFARRDLRFHSLLPRRPVVAGKRTNLAANEGAQHRSTSFALASSASVRFADARGRMKVAS
jgi:hypothetical protein